jgi:acyl-ACP thioesterase
MLSTWSRGTDGLFAFRDYRMTDESGETLLTGTTYWPMIDFTTRKPIRLKEIMSHYECCTDEATDHSVLERLKLPDMENPDGSFESPARYSMIDHAQHVNNAEYVRLVFDSLMQTEFDLDKPFSLEVNYQHETQPDDTLSVSRKQDNDAVWIQISNSRGLSVAAKVAQK